jgi:hypothetical protein
MIDFDKKIIFTHYPKCAGTTIEAAFNWHPSCFKKKSKEKRNATIVFKKFKHASLEQHIRYIEKSSDLSSEQFFKFTCIRNPWDLAVSWYFFQRYNKRKIAQCSFEEYVEKRCKESDFLNIKPFLFHKNNYSIDYVIRYENYEEDTQKIFDKYKVTWNKNFNTKSRPPNTPYKNFYNNLNTKNMIEEKSKTMIELFGYKF